VGTQKGEKGAWEIGGGGGTKKVERERPGGNSGFFLLLRVTWRKNWGGLLASGWGKGPKFKYGKPTSSWGGGKKGADCGGSSRKGIKTSIRPVNAKRKRPPAQKRN